jgi:hypothetical protein
MYQPYPTGSQDSFPVTARPPAPTPVLNAVKLMYASAGLCVILVLVNFVTKHSLQKALIRRFPHRSITQIHNVVNEFVVLAAFIAIISLALWIWMAWANSGGRNWARIVSSVLFGIFTVYLLFSLGGIATGAGKIVELVTWLLAIAALVLLWLRPSSAYFKPQ